MAPSGLPASPGRPKHDRAGSSPSNVLAADRRRAEPRRRLHLESGRLERAIPVLLDRSALQHPRDGSRGSVHQCRQSVQMKTKTTQHTPGPWKAEISTVRTVSEDQKEGGFRIADCYGIGSTQANANARLIAAAPDLLEALERCAQTLEAYAPKPFGWDYTSLNAARSVIAQAGGESEGEAHEARS